MPSAIYFDKDSIYTGLYARHQYDSGHNPMHTIRSIKTRIGTQSIVELPNGSCFDMVQCSAFLLKTIKHTIDTQFRGHKLAGAVVTVPAAFNIDERQATKNAMLLAGFSNVHILDEPTAALLYYINHNKDTLGFKFSPGHTLVYDIGGGTTDISIANINNDNSSLDVKIIGRSSRLDFGGDDFDQYLAAFLLARFEYGSLPLHQLPVPDQHTVIARMLSCAEDVKLKFNAELKRRNINRAKTIANFEVLNGKYLTDVVINHQLLCNVFADLTDKVTNSIAHTLANAGVTKEHIGEVILTGGMANFYLVELCIQNFFSDIPVTLLDTETAVSKGAAIYCFNLYNSTQLHIEDMLADDIIIKQGSSFKTIIPKTANIGDSGFFNYVICEDYLTRLEIALYYGQGNNPTKYTKLATKFAQLKSPVAKGDTLQIRWLLNKDKIIEIFIQQLDSHITFCDNNIVAIDNFLINGGEL